MKIPDFKKTGEYAAEVTVEASEKSVKVSVAGGTFLVRLLGVKTAKGKSSTDEHDNVIFAAKGKEVEIQLPFKFKQKERYVCSTD